MVRLSENNLRVPSMKVLLAGGAGFIGSHLCEKLLEMGNEVICVDDLSSGLEENLSVAKTNDNFRFIKGDITEVVEVNEKLDVVMNLASPASPKDYINYPIKTLEVGSIGTKRLLDLAYKNNAVFLLTSTSEVYGDPLEHPQTEDYWGNVNPIGPRSVYDEAKRFAEALTFSYYRETGLQIRVARIFNTYGPRIRPSDGRVVSNFIAQAICDSDLTIYGDGTQTRSLCYIDDQVAGLIKLAFSDCVGPVNIGNPQEISIADLAHTIIRLVGSKSQLIYEPLPIDDPVRRCPDISRAMLHIGWSPTVSLEVGLGSTIDWMRAKLQRDS